MGSTNSIKSDKSRKVTITQKPLHLLVSLSFSYVEAGSSPAGLVLGAPGLGRLRTYARGYMFAFSFCYVGARCFAEPGPWQKPSISDRKSFRGLILSCPLYAPFKEGSEKFDDAEFRHCFQVGVVQDYTVAETSNAVPFSDFEVFNGCPNQNHDKPRQAALNCRSRPAPAPPGLYRMVT